jgi:hypothetical protein
MPNRFILHEGTIGVQSSPVGRLGTSGRAGTVYRRATAGRSGAEKMRLQCELQFSCSPLRSSCKDKAKGARGDGRDRIEDVDTDNNIPCRSTTSQQDEWATTPCNLHCDLGTLQVTTAWWVH